MLSVCPHIGRQMTRAMSSARAMQAITPLGAGLRAMRGSVASAVTPLVAQALSSITLSPLLSTTGSSAVAQLSVVGGTRSAFRMSRYAAGVSDLSLELLNDEEEEPLRRRWHGATSIPGPSVSPDRFGPGAYRTLPTNFWARPARTYCTSAALFNPVPTKAAVVEDSGDEAEEAAGAMEGDGEAPTISVDAIDKLSKALRDRLLDAGITGLFPVQKETLLRVLDGQDVVVRSRTGSGKTLAFAIPVIETLSREPHRGKSPRCIVLTPTRELAKQVETEFVRIAGPIRTLAIYGGVAYQPQQQALKKGVDVVVGTPGRIIDLLESGHLKLGDVKYAILDESDEMLRMGFKEDCERIFQEMPGADSRQTMLWSATVPPWVRELARQYCEEPQFVDMVGKDDQKLPPTATFRAHIVNSTSRMDILSAVILDSIRSREGGRTLVFTDTKNEAYDLAQLEIPGVKLRSLTGDLSQAARETALNDFKSGKADVLVATDVAARGLDISDIDTVVHYRLPFSQEAFVHRSGRTARAGRTGQIVCLLERSELHVLARWERLLSFDTAVCAPPTVDVRTAVQEIHSKLLNKLQLVTPALLEAVKSTGLVSKVAGSGDAADSLAKCVAAAVLCMDSSVAGTGISVSLLTGERGMVTTMLQPSSDAFTKLCGVDMHARKRMDAETAKEALVSFMTACKVPATNRPRRLLIAPDHGNALVCDIPVDVLSQIQTAVAPTGDEKLFEPVQRLPESVKSSLFSASSDRSSSSSGDRRPRRGRGGGRGYGGGGGGYSGGGGGSSSSSSSSYRTRSESDSGRRDKRDFKGRYEGEGSRSPAPRGKGADDGSSWRRGSVSSRATSRESPRNDGYKGSKARY